MSEVGMGYPCTGRPACGGTAWAKLDPAHWERTWETDAPEFVGDRAIFECDTCHLRWDEYGRALMGASERWDAINE